MSSKNNVSKASSMFYGKGKHYWASIGLVVLVIAMVVAYYYVSKSNREGFEDGTPNLTPAKGECIVALFYAEWCGHCVAFKPKFENAMDTMNGKKSKGVDTRNKTVRFVMIDCDEHKQLATKYGVSGYPTVKILTDDDQQLEYSGERSLEGLQKYLVVDN